MQAELRRLSNTEAGLNFLFDLAQRSRATAQPTFFILEEFHAYAPRARPAPPRPAPRALARPTPLPALPRAAPRLVRPLPAPQQMRPSPTRGAPRATKDVRMPGSA